MASECEDQAQATATPSPNQDYIEDLNCLLAAATHPRTTALLQKALEEAQREDAPNGDKNGESGGSQAVKTAAVTSYAAPMPKSSGTVRTIPLASSTRISQYGWDQTPKAIKIYITGISDLTQISKDDIKADFKVKALEVEVKASKGKVYSLVINDLFDDIVPDQSSAKIKSGMVIVTLKKSAPKEWPFLTGREKKLKDAREPKTPKAGKDEDPGSSLMSLMKQMYQDGDDDMKRTIAKAWHESQEKRNKEPVADDAAASSSSSS